MTGPTSHADVGGSGSRGLVGCTVVVTRERVGELGRLLELAGADVVHVPLIEVIDVGPDERRALADAIARRPDWVIVTSPAGAERIAPEVSTMRSVRLAAVGTATAERLADLAGRPVDLVPERQLAEELVLAFERINAGPQRVVVAQADRAAATLADGLRRNGHDVTVATAYRTVVRRPSESEVRLVAGADAVTFASGSAATSWVAALGARAADLLPPIVVAIGPSTARAAQETGLKISHVAADHSLAGLIVTLTSAWNRNTE